MFTLYRKALAPAQKLYQTGLCSHIRTVILARFSKRSEDARRLKWRVTYWIGVHTIPNSRGSGVLSKLTQPQRLREIVEKRMNRLNLPQAEAQYFFILLCPLSNTLTIIRYNQIPSSNIQVNDTRLK